MAKPKTLDEVLALIQQEVGEIDSDHLEMLREIATPKGARSEIENLKKQLADAKPLIELGQQAQRAPLVADAFKAYQTENLPPAITAAMNAFPDLGDANKVAEFAKSYGLQPKPAEGTGAGTQPGSQTAAVVDAATASTPGTAPGEIGNAQVLQQELREAEARGASQAEQAAIMAKHGLNVVNGPVAQLA